MTDFVQEARDWFADIADDDQVMAAVEAVFPFGGWPGFQHAVQEMHEDGESRADLDEIGRLLQGNPWRAS